MYGENSPNRRIIAVRNRNSIPTICVFLILVIIVSAGCQSKKEKKPEITLGFWSDRFNRDFAQKCVNTYNTIKKPYIPVEYLPIEGKYTNKLLTLIAGGTPPDIMLLMPDEIADFASRGALLELTNFFNIDPDIDSIEKDIWPDLLEIKKFRGKDYGVPIWTNSIALFYNKDIFDKEGLTYPDKEWNWDTFFETAQRLTRDIDGDGHIDQFGFGSINYSLEPWYLHTYIRQNNGDLYNKDKTDCLIDSPESIEAIQWAIDLTRKYHVAPTRAEITSGQFGSAAGSYFTDGKVAMVWSGRWSMLEFAESAKFKWGVAPIFHGKKKIMFSAPVIFAVSSSTKYPKECWDFLKFMMTEEGQKLVISERTEIPILMSLSESPSYLNAFNRPMENAIFVRELKFAEPFPFVLGQSPWMDKSRDFLQSAALGDITVKEACQKIAADYEKMVAEGEIKP